MKVKRLICPSCQAETQVVEDAQNVKDYSEELVSAICGNKRCLEWNNSPEQKLLRALFGERR